MKMLLLGWLLKGHCDVTLLDNLICAAMVLGAIWVFWGIVILLGRK